MRPMHDHVHVVIILIPSTLAQYSLNSNIYRTKYPSFGQPKFAYHGEISLYYIRIEIYVR